MDTVLKGIPSDIDQGAVISTIALNFLCLIPIFYCLYVFASYLFKHQPRSVDRKKLVTGLNVLLVKSILLRNVVGFILLYTGSPSLWILGIVVFSENVPFYCCIPACWYTSFKNWWRVMNNQEVLELQGV